MLCDVGEVTLPTWASGSSFLRIGFSLLSLSAVNFSNSRLNFIHNHPITPALDDKKFKRPGSLLGAVKCVA